MKQTTPAPSSIIIRKFSHASLNTKLVLFRAYVRYMAVSYGVLCSSTHTQPITSWLWCLQTITTWTKI